MQDTTQLLKHWSTVFGERFMDAVAATKIYGHSTLGFQHQILGAVKPITTAEVSQIVQAANSCKTSLYTISAGKNWGYGCGVPTAKDCVIVDLSKMNQILELNEQLSFVTLQPGVTQQDLYTYFRNEKKDFMVPTTGAGPQASIVGNALERGYGITPHGDHFGAILQIEAVLADGSIYRSKLFELGGTLSDQVFKWKVGPFIDGLFAQGNIGIVTQATIALAQRPEQLLQFIIFIDNDNFEAAVHSISRIKTILGTQLGGINLIDKRRILSMNPTIDWPTDHPLSDEQLEAVSSRQLLSDWVVVGAIYSSNELSAGTCRRIKKEFSQISKKTLFLTMRKIKFLKWVLKIIPIAKIKNFITTAENAFELLNGVPNQAALPLAYLKNKNKSKNLKVLSPGSDRCGLIWFSPLVPMAPKLVHRFTEEIRRICQHNNLDPLITLSTISERCFDSTVPLLFDADSEASKQQARKCYNELIEMSRSMGIFPYRIDIEKMPEYFKQGQSVSQVVIDKIKQALDPNNILSPGRYSSVSDTVNQKANKND